jgi:CBS domain-containing protein
MRVADLMTTGVVTCGPDADLGTLAATLSRKGVHAVFILDALGGPAGVVTDFDLLAGEWLAADAERLEAMRTLTAGAVMSSPVDVIKADAPAAEAATRLRQRHLGRLLVTDDDGAGVGVISVGDLVAPLGKTSSERRCVADVMSRVIVTCSPQTSVEAACRAMAERRSRSVVVVAENGEAVGVVTGHDLLSLYEGGERPQSVSDLMSPPITCAPDTSLSAAADLMIEREVHRLVVTDPSRPESPPVGLVSTSDIVAEMAGEHSVWRRS